MSRETLWFCRVIDRAERRHARHLLPLDPDLLAWTTAPLAQGHWLLIAVRQSELPPQGNAPTPWAFYLAARERKQALLAVGERQAFLCLPHLPLLRAITLPRAPTERPGWLATEIAKVREHANAVEQPMPPLTLLTEETAEHHAFAAAFEQVNLPLSEDGSTYAETLRHSTHLATGKHTLHLGTKPARRRMMGNLATAAAVCLSLVAVGYFYEQHRLLTQQVQRESAQLDTARQATDAYIKATEHERTATTQAAAWERFTNPARLETPALADLQTRLQAVEDVWLESARLEDQQLHIDGRLLDRENPLAQVSPATEARVSRLFDFLAASPHFNGIADRRLDASQPGILHFSCTLELTP